MINIRLIRLMYFDKCTFYFIDTGPYLQPGETGAIIVSGGQIISNKGANVENLATVEVLFEDGRRWCTLPSLPYSRHEYSELRSF